MTVLYLVFYFFPDNLFTLYIAHHLKNSFHISTFWRILLGCSMGTEFQFGEGA